MYSGTRIARYCSQTLFDTVFRRISAGTTTLESNRENQRVVAIGSSYETARQAKNRQDVPVGQRAHYYCRVVEAAI
jgi:hypothetical protein